MVVGSIEKSVYTGRGDLFFSEGTVSLRDDCGVQAKEMDFTKDYYESVIECLTCISDWIFLPHLQSGILY